ncbi:DUF4815 domain-containing protein [Sulfidibacter corallicola]|uniref:DUF4815 domain-containing protein n=1 Tax=Sulfidibacter corallicola TaxID=2818388 RepID=A0A8A4TJA7_SULCO|nr:DUF4815 domain-containing protein [Sulfidibacter corallicola]QTD49683.1 DUF4815 domain-containing protein [Sulfidibacter corallicola]
MSISRDTFDPHKNYKRISFHQDRDLLDSELNEQQHIAIHERTKLFDAVFHEGSILSGFEVVRADHILTVGPGVTYIEGHIEQVPGAVLTFDPAKDDGADYVFVELLKYNVDRNTDATLINPATGEPTAERERWVLQLTHEDTTAAPLPNNVTGRRVLPIYKFDRADGSVTPIVKFKNKLVLDDLVGTLPGERIRVSSISEAQLSFRAAEGMNSLLDNMAERTHDQAGSYLVSGFDSVVGDPEDDHVTVTTNAGRAYIRGFRLQRDLPTSTLVPVSKATKHVRGEQKTFVADRRRYPVNSTPLKASTQVEAIVETTQNVTRGSVAGGEDLLSPNPVVTILEVSQGATTFQPGVDWNQSGNVVDWTGTGDEPGIGTTYTVRWTYTRQMERGVDYTDGGWFGGSGGHPSTGDYHYLVTAVDAQGESGFDAANVVTRTVAEGGINELFWLPVSGATGYRVYRGTGDIAVNQFGLLIELPANATQYIDDGVDVGPGTPPLSVGTSPLIMSQVALHRGNTNIINFGRTDHGQQPVPGSNCSIDYDYYLGRIDVMYATASEIKRLEGPPSDHPKMPVLPDGTLGLSAIHCPPNSISMTARNFGLRRITMDQIHDLIRDVERLKYNDAQSQMNADLSHREGGIKKGIYSDDFSSESQSDVHHPEWSARVDTVGRFVAPNRTATSHALQVDHSRSNVQVIGSLALLPGEETVLVQQPDWSEARNINPYAVFDPPPPSFMVSPNIGRRGVTGVTVTSNHFPPNEPITVRCAGVVVADGILPDSAGRMTATFIIPPETQLGNQRVSASNGSQGASAPLEINNPLDIARVDRVVTEPETEDTRIVRRSVRDRVWRSRFQTAKRDPLAQTFSFPVNRIVTAVGVWFAAKDPSIPVTVQIRGVTTGLPNDQVLAEQVMAPAEITTGSETKVTFDEPFYAEANTSYAVVLLTNSSEYQVQVATLGQMSQVGNRGIITSQAYPAGVLLESSNAETWTPLNGSDLRCNIYGRTFQPNGEIRFQPVTGVIVTQLNVDEFSHLPEGTFITWEYSTDGGQVWDALVPAEEEQLPNITNQVLVRARFVRTEPLEHESPALVIGDVALIGYFNDDSGVYITREHTVTQGIASNRIYAEMDVPSGTAVNWFASNNGESWEPMSLEATNPIDTIWTEYSYELTFADPNGTRIRFKAEMTGTNMVSPRIHRFGATLS